MGRPVKKEGTLPDAGRWANADRIVRGDVVGRTELWGPALWWGGPWGAPRRGRNVGRESPQGWSRGKCCAWTTMRGVLEED